MGYSLTRQQKREQAASEYKTERKSRKPTVTPSRTWVNSTMPPGSLKGSEIPVMNSGRGEEANQHKQFHGGGYQPQIDRRVS